MRRMVGVLIFIGALFIWALSLAGGNALLAQSAGQAAQPAQDPSASELFIINESPLPDTYPRANYEVRFHARGGVPTFHCAWRKEPCRPA